MRIWRWFVRILLTLLIAAAIGRGRRVLGRNAVAAGITTARSRCAASRRTWKSCAISTVCRASLPNRATMRCSALVTFTQRIVCGRWILARRLAQGRLSERFGNVALPTDTLMRALDLDGHAERSLSALTKDTRRALDVYAAGVNARLAEINQGEHGRGAPEFYLFGGGTDPWRPADSVSVVKTMAFQISMASLHREVARGRMLLALKPRQVRDLYPEYPGPGVDELPRYRKPRPKREAGGSPVRRAARQPARQGALPFDAALNLSRPGRSAHGGRVQRMGRRWQPDCEPRIPARLRPAFASDRARCLASCTDQRARAVGHRGEPARRTGHRLRADRQSRMGLDGNAARRPSTSSSNGSTRTIRPVMSVPTVPSTSRCARKWFGLRARTMSF